MSEFKPWGPGSKTGGETADGGAPGNQSFYPGRESGGYVTGGEAEKAAAAGSNVPSRPNSQAGNLSQVKSEMKAAVQQCADYGGHNMDNNPTGSSVANPAGSRTSEDAGFYGERPGSSAGTNAGGGGGAEVSPSRGYSESSDKDA